MNTELETIASKHSVAYREGEDLLLAILRFADKAREIDAVGTVSFLENIAAAYRVGMQMQQDNGIERAALHATCGGI